MTPVREPEGGGESALYRRLEVGPGASHDEIVRAYRRLALGVHPDAHPENPEASLRFREITEAYEVLADPVRRQAYDGTRAPRPSSVVPPPGTTATAFQATTASEVLTMRPPTVLGTSKLPPGGDPLLRVGPVHIGAPSESEEGSTRFAAHLFSILDSWWGR